jgi:hypothetical protein
VRKNIGVTLGATALLALIGMLWDEGLMSRIFNSGPGQAPAV